MIRSGTTLAPNHQRTSTDRGVLLLRAVRNEPNDERVADLLDRRDQDLVEQVAAGDEDAFVSLYRRYGAAAFGLALRVLGDRVLAEEVTQEVFLSVWRRARNYEPGRGSVRSWLLTQIHHRAVDVVRREEAERRRNAGASLPAVDESIEQVVEDQWLAVRRAQMRTALEVLPEEQRAVIELSYFEGLTQTQVADRLGTPLGTVKSRTLAAMKKLRGALQTAGGS